MNYNSHFDLYYHYKPFQRLLKKLYKGFKGFYRGFTKVCMREVDASEHTLALLELVKERRQKENKIEKVSF